MKRGGLEEIPYAVLLLALAVHRRSVALRIRRGPIEKTIVFENGVPVDCRSNLLQDTLGQFMVARGDITQEQCQSCLSESISSRRLMGEVLIAKSLITPSALYKILQQNLGKKLLDAFTWRTGSFEVVHQTPRVEAPLEVKPAQLILTGILKLSSREEVTEAIGPLVGKTLYIHPHPAFPIEELRLPAQQLRIAKLISSGKRIDELVGEANVNEAALLQLVYALAVLGIVVPEEWLPEDAREATNRFSPADVAALQTTQPPSGDATVAPETLGNELMEMYLHYRTQDAFELFSVPTNATMPTIEGKYVEFSRKFAPWQFEAPGLSHLAAKARDLFLAGARAYGELSDPEKRNSLVARRQRPIEQPSPSVNRDQFVIKTDFLNPEIQFKEGLALMKAGKYREAMAQLQFASDCDPQTALYRAELAYCRYLHQPEFELEKAVADLEEALRMDSGCGVALYYSGLLHGELEHFDEAEARLVKAIKLMKPDHRPIDALKALSSRKKAFSPKQGIGRLF